VVPMEVVTWESHYIYIKVDERSFLCHVDQHLRQRTPTDIALWHVHQYNPIVLPSRFLSFKTHMKRDLSIILSQNNL
jgi:hypothetical protein